MIEGLKFNDLTLNIKSVTNEDASMASLMVFIKSKL
jgi:hypothetical protein